MEVLNAPVELASKKACNTKGCKKYTCIYHIFGK